MRKTQYNCPNCHRFIQFKQKECSACGTKIDWSGRFCPNCNYRVEQGGDCPRCGMRIYWPIEERSEANENIDKFTQEVEDNIKWQEADKPDLWQWYFCKHPRVLVLVPVFLMFVYFGLIYGLRAITDIIYFFQIHTWGAVGVFLVLGGFMIPVVFIPSIIAFGSISWLHAIHRGVKNSWAKLGLTIFLIFILPILSNLLRYVFLLIMGISEKYSYTVLPYW
jgi:RNA polymerase subunit RPABC4/transcription elongation factor Spt4